MRDTGTDMRYVYVPLFLSVGCWLTHCSGIHCSSCVIVTLLALSGLKIALYFMQVNPDMVPQLEKAGLLFTGRDETGQRMQVGHLVMISECVFLLLFSFWEWGCFAAMTYVTVLVLSLFFFLKCRLLNCPHIHTTWVCNSTLSSNQGQEDLLPFSQVIIHLTLSEDGLIHQDNSTIRFGYVFSLFFY